MTASLVPESQQSRARPAAGGAPARECFLESGQAHSLHPRAALQLRVLRGRAWVTLGAGPGGWLGASGDVLLHAGQSVCVPAGARAVVEPLGRDGLHYQWRAAAARAAAQPARRAAAAPAQARPCGA